MLVATFRIQQKQWNLHLPNLSCRWRFQDISVHRSLPRFRSRSTYANPEASQKARDAASSIRKSIAAKDTLKAKETTYSMLNTSSQTRWCYQAERAYSSRLVAHSLVHALLRQGQVMEAGYEMKKIMSLGVLFHHRTIQKNISFLCSMPSYTPVNQNMDLNGLTNQVYPGDSESGFLLSALHSRLPPPTRLATSLLITGRRYRQKRTEDMFSKLIDACLLQGEIIIATLLFVLLVKDWQIRSIVRSSRVNDEPLARDPSKPPKSGFPTTFFAKTIALDRLQIPYPELRMLHKITDSIQYHMLFTNTPTETHLASIESLTLLAQLVEEGSLPYGNISTLLRIMQDCPRGSLHHPITIQHRGRMQTLPVYRYLHNILTDLCNDPPSQKPKKADLASPRMLHPLDLRSYNTLLHYSLRHRFSPALANRILEHMRSRRKPPLKPDMATYNILLRSASLLGRNDIAYAVLEELKDKFDGFFVPLPEFQITTTKQLRRNLPKRIAAEILSVPCHGGSPSVKPDNYTLSSYILHLVSTSQLQTLVRVLIELFPILEDSPSQWHIDPTKFQESLNRAVSYGPYVLAAFLNGCQKAGKTGLAERLWLLAKEAEFASWYAVDSQTSSPWCLSIEAYTSILQCYANESKKGINGIRGHRYLTLQSESRHRDLADRNKHKHAVGGWGYFVMKLRGTNQPLRSSRHEASKLMGWFLLHSVLDAAFDVSRVLGQLRTERPDIPPERLAQLEYLGVPVLDVRFINVLLFIFGRRPGMQCRRISAGRSWWKRKLRIGFERYWRDRTGTTTYDPKLAEIADIIASYGYTLPLGFRRVLIGRPNPTIRQDIVRKRDILPWAHPFRTIASKPFAIPIRKTRSLTLHRKHRRSRRRTPGC